MTLEEVNKKIKRHLPEIRKKYKVKSLGVFGSYVKEEQTKRSDVDILVEFSGSISFFKLLELEEYLEEKLGVKVDLVMKSALKPAIGKRILEEVMPVL